jgi:hypothetical protein
MKKIIYVLLFLAFASLSNAQWVQYSNGMGSMPYVFSLAVSLGNNIFAGLGGPGSGTGVYISTNSGTSWTQTGLNNTDVFSIAISGNKIFAGSNSGVYLSTNNGTSWTQTPLSSLTIEALAINGTNYNVFAGGSGGVYVSTNNGSNWTQTSLNSQYVRSLLILGNYIFAGTEGNGVYFSTNNGTNWTQTTLNNQSVWSFGVLGSYIFAGTGSSGIYISTNNGINWTQNAAGGGTVFTFATLGSNIFVGKFNGIYLSTNNGANWLNKNQGFSSNPTVRALLIANNYIFAGVYGSYVWRRDYSEAIGINNISTEIPDKYSLSQNYPNPFNPNTNIKFQVKSSGNIKLVVFDILGKEVVTLVNEKLAPGTYEVSFDASAYPSGVYFYKLITDGFTENKKMTLIK